MTTLDAGLIILCVLFIGRGIWIGFFRQLAAIAALFIGFIAAGYYYAAFSEYINKFISETQLAFIITYALIFVVTYAMVIILGILLKKVMQISFLGWFDKLLGGIFGFLKAAFICTLLFMALAWFLSSTNPLIQKSFLSPYLMISSEYLTSLIKDKKLQSELLPKKPAISAFLGDPVKFFQVRNGKSE